MWATECLWAVIRSSSAELCKDQIFSALATDLVTISNGARMAVNISSVSGSLESTNEKYATTHLGRLDGSLGSLGPSLFSEGPAEQILDRRAFPSTTREQVPLEEARQLSSLAMVFATEYPWDSQLSRQCGEFGSKGDFQVAGSSKENCINILDDDETENWPCFVSTDQVPKVDFDVAFRNLAVEFDNAGHERSRVDPVTHRNRAKRRKVCNVDHPVWIPRPNPPLEGGYGGRSMKYSSEVEEIRKADKLEGKPGKGNGFGGSSEVEEIRKAGKQNGKPGKGYGFGGSSDVEEIRKAGTQEGKPGKVNGFGAVQLEREMEESMQRTVEDYEESGKGKPGKGNGFGEVQLEQEMEDYEEESGKVDEEPDVLTGEVDKVEDYEEEIGKVDEEPDGLTDEVDEEEDYDEEIGKVEEPDGLTDEPWNEPWKLLAKLDQQEGKLGKPRKGNEFGELEQGKNGVDEEPDGLPNEPRNLSAKLNGRKVNQQEGKLGKPRKGDGVGKLERGKKGEGKSNELEELMEDEVDEEEECGKVGKIEDPDLLEELRKISARHNERVDYEPYRRQSYPEEEDPLDDDFITLNTMFVRPTSGPSSHTKTAKNSPEGNGACDHRNFDFDEAVGYYCGDCGTIGLEMPASDSDEQNKGCLHKNYDFLEETGKFCTDCGKVLQDIQNLYFARTDPRKQTQKVQHQQEHQLLEVELPLQVCNGNDDFRGADLELHPLFEENLHPHQKKGFKFLTESLLGGQKGSHESTGCVLAHAPGTGKTCLVISFIQSFLSRFPGGKPLILAPAIMLQSWENQFEHWKAQEVPIYRFGGFAREQDEEDARLVPHDNVKTSLKESRAVKLLEWQREKGVLLMSYDLFSRLVSNGLGDHVLPESLDYKISKILMESPNLVILDEGHIARNDDAQITQALLALETKRRVLLSGTLFHNNFKELYTLLKLCRDDFMINHPVYGKKMVETAEINDGPKYGNGISLLERKTKKELMQIEKKIFIEEIGHRLEHYVNSGETRTDEIESVVKKLQSLTSSFVDWYPGKILKSLPGLIEYSIHFNLTRSQEQVIHRLVNSEQMKNHLSRRHLTISACIHPSFVDLVEDSEKNSSSLEEAREGVKLAFLLQLMEICKQAREKLLIFCSILRPITYIENLFCKVWGWCKGQQIMRLDGEMSDSDRQRVIQMFNENSTSRVLVASTSACKEGITLVGASRVVFLDTLENPSVTRQAVSRAFRIGQTKKVYVYRLVTTYSHEELVFRRSVSKERLSQVLLDPASSMSTFENFLQEQRASDIEDKLLRDLVLADRANGSNTINVVHRYNAAG